MLVKTALHYVRINLNDRPLSLSFSLSRGQLQSVRAKLLSDVQPTREQKINNPARTLDCMTDVSATKIISVTDGEILKVHAIS